MLPLLGRTQSHVSVDLLAGWWNLSKWSVLKPEVTVRSEHEDFRRRQPLEGLNVSVDLLAGWWNVSKWSVLKPEVTVRSEREDSREDSRWRQPLNYSDTCIFTIFQSRPAWSRVPGVAGERRKEKMQLSP